MTPLQEERDQQGRLLPPPQGIDQQGITLLLLLPQERDQQGKLITLLLPLPLKERDRQERGLQEKYITLLLHPPQPPPQLHQITPDPSVNRG